MFSRFLIVAFLVLFLTGCATTGKNTNTQTAQQLQNQVQELQSRINFLEEELQNKDQEISYLEGNQSTPSSSQKQTKSSTTVTLSIRQTQTALKNAGFYKGAIDGKLGTQTKSAIKRFQKAKGLKADGIIGQKTALALSRYLTK